MRWTYATPVLGLLTTSVSATMNLHHLHPELVARQIHPNQYTTAHAPPPVEKRQTQPLFLTDQTRSTQPSMP